MVLLFIGIGVPYAYGAWQGPVTVVAGVWGNATGQIGFETQDTGDDFPDSFGVSSSGNIVIADSINEVLHVFNGNGVFQRDIKNTFVWRGWPGGVLVNNECAVVDYVQFTQTFNILTGALIGKADNMGGADYVSDDCSTIYAGGNEGWKAYSPTGQLIKTSATRPLELGDVKSQKLGENNYKITVTYPDKVYGLSADRIFTRYIRDTRGFVYGVNAGGAWRFNQCGKLTGTVLMPSSNIQETPRPGGGENIVTVNAEYGEPVVAPSGDVYTWKREGNYSIIKWTWVDDPNVPSGPDAPAGLNLMPSTTGLYLTWTASAQDPGCVTGYEVSRAMSAGGVGSTVATLNKGVVKYNDTTATAGTMYYYKIRAVAGSEYSPLTSEVSGKRP